ncbi:MAG: type II toxin-antitoxin system MqsA family antitoxin [Ardenticatenaceae bacterium]
MNDTIDRCDICGGELKPGVTKLQILRGQELIVIRDVQADVCQQCDEAYISAHVSERLDHFVSQHHRHRPERYLAVPQYSAVQAMAAA